MITSTKADEPPSTVPYLRDFSAIGHDDSLVDEGRPAEEGARVRVPLLDDLTHPRPFTELGSSDP